MGTSYFKIKQEKKNRSKKPQATCAMGIYRRKKKTSRMTAIVKERKKNNKNRTSRFP